MLKLMGGTYATWAQNQPAQVISALARSIARKSRISFAGFEQFWLLACCGTPQLGAIVSTFVMTPWLDVGQLDALTAQTCRHPNTPACLSTPFSALRSKRSALPVR